MRDLLRVRPGTTCLRFDTLAAEVQKHLPDSYAIKNIDIVVDGSLTDPRSLRLYVTQRGHVIRRRDFDPGPANCSALHAAVGFAIALAIKAAIEEQLHAQQLEEPPDRAPRQWSLALSGLGVYRVVPGLGPGLELALGRALGETIDLRLGAFGVIARGAEVARQRGSFHAILVAVRTEVCASTTLGGPVRAGLCAGVFGGGLHTVGVDMPLPASATVPYIALSAAAELELALSPRWAVRLGVSPLFLLHAVRVGVTDERGARVASRTLDRVGFSFGLGLVSYF